MIFSSLFSNEKSRLIVGNVILKEYVSNPLVSVGFWTSLGELQSYSLPLTGQTISEKS